MFSAHRLQYYEQVMFEVGLPRDNDITLVVFVDYSADFPITPSKKAIFRRITHPAIYFGRLTNHPRAPERGLILLISLSVSPEAGKSSDFGGIG